MFWHLTGHAQTDPCPQSSTPQDAAVSATINTALRLCPNVVGGYLLRRKFSHRNVWTECTHVTIVSRSSSIYTAARMMPGNMCGASLARNLQGPGTMGCAWPRNTASMFCQRDSTLVALARLRGERGCSIRSSQLCDGVSLHSLFAVPVEGDYVLPKHFTGLGSW